MGDICKISSDYEEVFRNLDSRAVGSAISRTLMAGAKALQKETVAQLKKKMGEAATSAVWRKKPHSPMTEGVRIGTRYKDYGEVNVHIMGDFRLKWFELGTDERWAGGRKNKNGDYAGSRFAKNYRGRIRPNRFFSDARNNLAAVERAMDEKMKKELDKLSKT